MRQNKHHFGSYVFQYAEQDIAITRCTMSASGATRHQVSELVQLLTANKQHADTHIHWRWGLCAHCGCVGITIVVVLFLMRSFVRKDENSDTRASVLHTGLECGVSGCKSTPTTTFLFSRFYAFAHGILQTHPHHAS